MTETNEAIKLYRGLRGVYFDRSRCTFIDGKAGELRYRGYSIHDLAEHSTFEETARLLLHGELPTRAQLAAFDADLRAARTVPNAIIDFVRVTRSAHPMDVLSCSEQYFRSACSVSAGSFFATKSTTASPELSCCTPTAARVPAIEMGESAADALVQAVEYGEPILSRSFEATIVFRDSTAKP